MAHYMIHCPGMIYAVDEYAKSKRAALNQYKNRWGLLRMPKGYAIWST